MRRSERPGGGCKHILVMGVSGAGKTSVAKALSACLCGVFIEADDFHPQSNIALMSSGQALNDDHRWPWLKAIADAVREAEVSSPRHVIIACSALKRVYRDRLRELVGPMEVVHLSGSQALIEQRLAARRDHFMPSALLSSQFATLEPLGSDEEGCEISVELPAEKIVQDLCARFSGERRMAGLG